MNGPCVTQSTSTVKLFKIKMNNIRRGHRLSLEAEREGGLRQQLNTKVWISLALRFLKEGLI